jgi:hypothetical protein
MFDCKINLTLFSFALGLSAKHIFFLVDEAELEVVADNSKSDKEHDFSIPTASRTSDKVPLLPILKITLLSSVSVSWGTLLNRPVDVLWLLLSGFILVFNLEWLLLFFKAHASILSWLALLQSKSAAFKSLRFS